MDPADIPVVQNNRTMVQSLKNVWGLKKLHVQDFDYKYVGEKERRKIGCREVLIFYSSLIFLMISGTIFNYTREQDN